MKFLVAGASGYLGRFIVAELHRREIPVRALVRNQAAAEKFTVHDAPQLHGLVDDWFITDVTKPETLDGICKDITHVISALGVTKQKADPWDVDFLANLHLLEHAEAAGVESFSYINVINSHVGTSILARAKYAFSEVLKRSSLKTQIINPSGYFSDLTEIFNLVKRGIAVQFGDGNTRMNPIHGSDLAKFVVDHALGESGQWDVGGPDIFTMKEVYNLASRAMGKAPRTINVSPQVAKAGVWAADRIGPRASTMARFMVDQTTLDSVGQPYGKYHLADYYQSLAAAQLN